MTGGGRVLIPDARADPDYSYGAGPQIGRYRALFGAPMIRDGRVEGVFGLMHPKPSAFMPRQMEMVRVFRRPGGDRDRERAPVRRGAGQDARPRERRSQQQTATAEVLKVISRSAFDLQAVWRTLVEVGEYALRRAHGPDRAS